MKNIIRNIDGPTRRAFMRNVAMSAFGVSVMSQMGERLAFGAPTTAATAGKAKSVIYIYLNGGMSHIDTFDPKPGQDTAGEFKAIGTNVDGVQFSEHLSKLAKQMDKMTVIRSMTSSEGAHERSRYLMHTSYDLIPTIKHASVGAWLARTTERVNKNIPPNILIGNGGNFTTSGFLDKIYDPLVIGDPKAGLQNVKLPPNVTEREFAHRRGLAAKLDGAFRDKYKHANVKAYTDYYAQAVRMMQSEDVKAFDINKESQTVRDEYGESRFAQGCLLARRLVETGVRFVEITDNGWDTHQDNFETLEEKLPVLDRGLSALLSDLQRRGLLETTLVVLTTEFGRTPKVNGRAGRDHYPRVFSAMMAGGGIRGGRIHGGSDAKGTAIKNNAVNPADFNATIAYAMGVSHKTKVISKIGRPFALANEGKPVTELFA
jgi:hypothetical protein